LLDPLRSFDPNVGNNAAHLSGQWATNLLGNGRLERSRCHHESSTNYCRKTYTTQLTPTPARDLSPDR
jgi:hypothetical protein